MQGNPFRFIHYRNEGKEKRLLLLLMAISYSLLWVESWWWKKATFNWSKIGKGDINAHLSPTCQDGQGGLERLLKGPSIAFRVIKED